MGPVKTELPQYQIWGQLDDNPKALLGYVGTQPGAPINIIVPDLPGDLVAQIQTQVKALLANVGDQVAQRPSTAQMEELESSLTDDEDWQDDEES
jgi:hypothetical protein